MLPPPMMSVPPATTPPPSYRGPRASDVDLRRERVVLDEPPPVLDDLAHQLREEHLRLGRVLDRDLLQRARLRVHRRLAQLLGVHLAQALEAVQADAGLLAHDLEDRLAQRLERRGLLGLVAEHHRERRHARRLDERRVHAQEVAVLGCLEELAADPVRLGQAGLALDPAHAQRALVLVEHLGGHERAVVVRPRQQPERLLGGLDLLVEQRGLLEERDDLVAVLGPQRARPALVLLAQARVLLPARLGELERLVVAVEDLDAVELVGEQDLLELGLLLDVALVAALLELVERRLGDVDVAGLDQVLHLAEEQREDERADVGPVHVGVRHEDHLVVAGALEVELVAHAGADRGDERLDLLVAQDLVDPRALDVEDLAAEGKHRLCVAVAALLGRAAGGVALDDEDLAQGRVLNRAVGELARQARVLERALAAGEVARLARGRPRLGGGDGLADDLARVGGVLLEELGELLVDDRGDEALHAGVAELGLGLALELRVGELGRDDRGQPLADILAREVLVPLLQLALLARVAVERARERRAEAREMRAALVRVDVVREREDGLLVGGVPLERHLDRALGALALEEHDLLLNRVLALVEVANEVLDAALVLELDAIAAAALVGERDLQAAREEGGLAQALLEDREVEVERLEDVGVRQERDRRAGRLRGLALLQVVARRAAVVLLRPGEPVAPDLDLDGLAQSVYDGDPDAVQAAGHLVAAAVTELAAGVKDGQDDLDRGPALLLHRRDWDAATVVDDRDGVVGVDRDVHRRRVAGQSLVNGVVDHLVDEMVEATHAGGPDVHAGALADRLETLQDGDVLSVVCPAVLVLRHMPPNDVKNPGSGLTDTRPGHQRIMETIVADRGVSPPARNATKVLQNSRNLRHRRRQPDLPRGATARQRSARTRSPPRSAFSCATRSGPMRSSSWAQTADEHVTRSTPSRSPVGSACAATTSPTARAQTRWTSARSVSGASRSASAATARPAGRGSRRLMRRAPASRPSPRRRGRRAAARRPPRPRPGRG